MICNKNCNCSNSIPVTNQSCKGENGVSINNTDTNISTSFENQEEGNREYVEVEMRSWKILYFTNPQNISVSPDDLVIVEVDRGLDIGKVMHTSVKGKIYDEQYDQGKVMVINRCATENDLKSLDELNQREETAKEKFLEALVKYPFEMKLLDTIYQFDGNKVTFFYTADGRVDFREFVKELAKIFKTRIELHQCTGRDEAKKIGGYGMCGNMYCCSSFMKRFNQVTIKMAKDQNLSGNLSKISGPCGRLLCCLHYEEEYYTEIAKDFPEMGDEIILNKRKMYVYRNDLYTKTIYLTSDTQEIETMTLETYKAYIEKKDKKEKVE
ncbi:MAG: Tpl protein [Candidatus Cloacimonetes bacterium]|nr:Tpl protein [Candidatus Cloacimonadota bacterium]